MGEKNNHRIPSSIRDNRARGSVGEFLSMNLTPNADVSIVSAYFTIHAYHHLKEKLDEIEHLDFLFGEPTYLRSIDPNKKDRKAFEIRDNDLVIPFESRLRQRRIAKECADWIREKVNIKSVVRSNFLHGKMYHIRQETGLEKAIVGSSNFTLNGLGLGQKPNIELNIAVDSDRDRKDLNEWFYELWDDDSGLVQDVKDEVLKYLEQFYLENDPEFIYFKTLYHIFEKFLAEQKTSGILDEKIGFFDTHVWKMLYDFQKDAVRGAVNKIQKHNGCIIADSVGLGKTFEALAIIKYFELKNDRILVLCPKKLEENWNVFRRNDQLNPLLDDRFRYDVLAHTDLSRQAGFSGTINLSTLNWGNYDLVVIDESHNFRNSSRGRRDEDGTLIKSRYARLLEDIIQSGSKTRVLLLTATPVNTNLKDLRNQIYLITAEKDDALRESANINNIGQTLKNAQTQFTNWADPQKNPERSVKDLLERLDSAFFKLLDELTIARSRKHILAYYDFKAIGAFPERRPVISKAPDIDANGEFPSYNALNQKIMQYKLCLFNPFAYVKKDKQPYYEALAGGTIKAFTQTRREHYLIGMMKVNFLKRLESSIESFEISLKRTLDKITALEEKIREFQLRATVDEIFDFEAFDTGNGEEDEEFTDWKENWNIVGKKFQYKLQDLELDDWLDDLQKDKAALTGIYEAAKAVTSERDQKVRVLKELLATKINNPINSGNKKALIFTAFADTAYYLFDCLKEWATNEMELHIALVTGGSQENRTSFAPKGFTGQTDFNAILTNFSPISKQRAKMSTMPQQGEIDILIATDCISEGQNLQDCDYLVNYDIHWNPVRIIQRFGRIDRLRSRNKQVQLVNFWPTDDLNNYINLKERVEARMALVDVAATGEENLLNPEQIRDLVEDELKYRDKQLLRLKNEVLDLEDLDENISLTDFTLDDFRMELMNFIQQNKERLANAPMGLYAVVPAPAGEQADLTDYSNLDRKAQEKIRPGVIFCLKQRESATDNERVNPLQPYFLVYVYSDGTVRYNYTNAKQILEVYRALCQGRSKPYQQLCDLLNDETDHGRDMAAYSALLQKAAKEIIRIFRHRSLRTLTTGRDAVLVPEKTQAASVDDFELISWLIIR